MPTILLTGANGFLAKAVAAAVPAEWRLVGLVRDGSAIPASSPKYSGIHDSLEALAAAEPRVDAILHLAARVPGAAGIEQDMLHANAGLPIQLLMLYPRARHVLASSVSVYGTPSELPLSVASPARPTTPYGWSKLAAECVVRTAERFAILRLSSVIGRGMRSGSFIPAAVMGARQGRIRLVGQASRTQDYIDVADAAGMFLRAAVRSDNFVTLAVSGLAPTNLEVAELLASLTGASIEMEAGGHSPSFSYTLSGSVELGPCETSLLQTLKAMVEQ
jgi:UDP-glucose 4-epimerase